MPRILKKSPKAIIFDFDGTLANTFLLIYECFREVFRQQGITPPTDAEINALFGPTEEVSLRKALSGRADTDKATKLFLEFYDLWHPRFVPDVPEVRSFLKGLNQRGLKFGIFTGKGRSTLEITLRHLFSDVTFGVTVTGDDVSQAKPHPEGLWKAIECLSVDASEALFVGDSDSDMKAGSAANVETVRCSWLGHLPGFPAQTWLENPCFANLHDFDNSLKP